MFDWDDQELANIIWGEGREADDHIVPYPEDIEKKVLSDYVDNEQKRLSRENTKREVAEKNTCTSKALDGGKGDTSGLSVSGAVVDSQLEMPSFSASKPDEGGVAKKSQLDIGLETSGNHHEDKELGDLVGNSWVSIGSFDDLDKIFSNDDLDGNTSLGSTDELWSSPKDLLRGPAKSSSAALGSTSWEFGALANTSAEINSEFLQNENPCIAPSHQKADSPSPCSRQKSARNVERAEDKIGLGITLKAANDSHIVAENIASPRNAIDMEQWSKIKSKQDQADDGRTASRLLRDIYDPWPSSAANVPQFGRQCAPAMVQNYSASFPGQQTFSQDISHMPYQHFPTPYGVYAYGNFSNQHPVMDILNPTEDEHQPILSSSEASPGDVISLKKPAETTAKPTKMTPEEKIEKLRRRQQMRAMLAIQKQQQQLDRQAPSGEYPLPHMSCPEDQVQHIEKSDPDADEILRTLPCYDPGSPNKGDDSSRISSIDDYSVEDTVLYQLQNIISRLDMNIRLCIRDSLYRLAHSATQRHYTSDTSGIKRSGTYEHDVAKEETSNHERVGILNVETETNRIDRAVAHLLFHRPLKLSARHVETPESSTSTKVSTDKEVAAPRNLQVGLLTKSSENELNLSPHGSKSPCAFADSQEEDVSHDVSRKEMRINPQIKEMKAEHAE